MFQAIDLSKRAVSKLSPPVIRRSKGCASFRAASIVNGEFNQPAKMTHRDTFLPHFDKAAFTAEIIFRRSYDVLGLGRG